jgi:hypothetical protein
MAYATLGMSPDWYLYIMRDDLGTDIMDAAVYATAFEFLREATCSESVGL